MKPDTFEIESSTLFSESLIWELNRNFYHENGIAAFSDEMVPHNVTNNSKCARTYAKLIFALLQDISTEENSDEPIYILELGAGHGRLSFQILRHLQKMVDTSLEVLPNYCYVLSDIVEENLNFFLDHHQLQEYFEKGVLDVAYFDSSSTEKLDLRYGKKCILPNQLNQPIVVVANYFFDSIPNELLYFNNNEVSPCSVAINSDVNPNGMDAEEMIENMSFVFSKSISKLPIYESEIINDILDDYRKLLKESFIFFPKLAMLCLQNIEKFSNKGMMLLTMDKGFHEIQHLKSKKVPEIITHGSFSIWVNFHALCAYCLKKGGKILFPSFSNFHFEIGCLLFFKENQKHQHVEKAYEQSVNDFGPDDFNSIKQLAYENVANLNLIELIALYRLGIYDSSFFIRLLPRLKQLIKTISLEERTRLAQTMDLTWDMYFHINESFDLAYEIGGLYFDLAYYEKALIYFQRSTDIFGLKADVFYNQALCYYQLRQDQKFHETVKDAKASFPGYELYNKLDLLDMV